MRLRSIALLTLLLAAATPVAAASADATTDALRQATIAYTRYSGNASKPPSVWAKTGGAAPVKLSANGYGPVVSHHGTMVAFSTTTRSSTKLQVVPAAGGTPKTLVTNMVAGTPVWSPDDTHVVAALGPEVGKQTLVVIDITTAAQLKLATGYFSGFSYKADGGSIAFSKVARSAKQGLAGDVYIVHPFPDGASTPKNITNDGVSLSPVWGPKGIAFSHLTRGKRKEDYPKANLQLIQPDGSGRQTLTRLKVPYLLFGLSPTAWSADGNHLLAEYGGQDYSEAWTYDFTTKKARDLTGKDDGVIGFGISADGKTVLAGTGGYDPQSRSDLVTYAFGGGSKKTLVKGGNFATWAGF